MILPYREHNTPHPKVQGGAAVPSSATLKLWDHLFGELEGGYLVTFTGKQSERPDARRGSLDDTDQRSWSWPKDREKAAEYLRAESDRGRDAYFGVHLFRDRGNRRKDNAAEVLAALWVDGDGAEVPEDWPQPTATVESSPGRHHYYWKLTRPVASGEASRLNKRLCYGMGADKGKWGLGTVLRAPGTFNYKREPPTEVREATHA